MENMVTPKNGVFFKDLKLGAVFNLCDCPCVKIVNNEYGYDDYLALELESFGIIYPNFNDICYPIDTLVGKYNQS